jgi:hypothetical protein
LDYMSLFDLYNALQINDLQRDTHRSALIMELGQRAESLGASVRPKSWYEFKKENQEKLNLSPVKKALIGAAIGAIVGAALVAGMAAIVGGGLAVSALPVAYIAVPAIGAAITGAIIGQNVEVRRENEATDKLVANYSAYLDKVEESHSKIRGVASEINYRDDHAARLKQQNRQIAR